MIYKGFVEVEQERIYFYNSDVFEQYFKGEYETMYCM